MDSPKWNVNLESHALSGKKSDDVSYQYENGSVIRKHLGELRLHPIKTDNVYSVSMAMIKHVRMTWQCV